MLQGVGTVCGMAAQSCEQGLGQQAKAKQERPCHANARERLSRLDPQLPDSRWQASQAEAEQKWTWKSEEEPEKQECLGILTANVICSYVHLDSNGFSL